MGLGSLLSFLSTDLAIDLGTANTCVYAKGRGIVVNEPSIVAVNKVNGRVEAVGKEAKEMLGRTPGNIVAIKPMKDGVIADFEVTEKMLTYFIKKAHNGNVWVHRGSSSAYRSRSRRWKSAPSKTAPTGQGQRGAPRRGSDGGCNRRRAAHYRTGGQHGRRHRRRHHRHCRHLACGHRLQQAVRVAGNEMDEAIIGYMKKTYNLLIGERTAEQIKMELGSAYPVEER